MSDAKRIGLAVLLLSVLAMAHGTPAAHAQPLSDSSKRDAEEQVQGAPLMSRLDIAQEHHQLMQQIIEGLRDVGGTIYRILAQEEIDESSRDEMRAAVRALVEKAERMSRRHEMLMQAVDALYREASLKKSSTEEVEEAVNHHEAPMLEGQEEGSPDTQ